MKGAFFISMIGIIQVISYRVGFSPGYSFGWLFNKWAIIKGDTGIRMNSFFGTILLCLGNVSGIVCSVLQCI